MKHGNAPIVILYTTIASMREAEVLAEKALSARLAACVNIIPNGKSIYLWEEGIARSEECYMIFKTTQSLISGLEDFLSTEHPYKVPALIKIEANASNKFYDYICSYLS